MDAQQRLGRWPPLLATALAALLVGVALGATFVAGRPGPTGSSPSPRPTVTRAPTPSPSPPDTSVSAAAIVVPLRSADLAPAITGRVAQIFVKPNERVVPDQLLLRLDQSAYAAEIEVAGANVDRAQAAVDQAHAAIGLLPPDATQPQRDAALADLALAQADLEVAQSTRDQALVAVRQTEVRAPFTGMVAEIGVSVGEQAVAGRPIITVADFSGWLIETTDVSELDVVRVAVGDQATITFDALPSLQLAGTVDSIEVRGVADGAGAKFTVIVRPLVHHPELHWNMSARLHIMPGS